MEATTYFCPTKRIYIPPAQCKFSSSSCLLSSLYPTSLPFPLIHPTSIPASQNFPQMLPRTIFTSAAACTLSVSALAVVKRQGNSTSAVAAGLPADFASQYQAFVHTFNNQSLAEDVFTSDFYSTPSNFSESMKPGEVLRIEEITGTDLNMLFGYPAGFTLWRLMYTSSNVYNKTVPATSFVLAPYFLIGRTVVWAHGTSGITRDCAPSNQNMLYYSFSGLFPLVQQGYTVIGPDYAGRSRSVPLCNTRSN